MLATHLRCAACRGYSVRGYTIFFPAPWSSVVVFGILFIKGIVRSVVIVVMLVPPFCVLIPTKDLTRSATLLRFGLLMHSPKMRNVLCWSIRTESLLTKNSQTNGFPRSPLHKVSTQPWRDFV